MITALVQTKSQNTLVVDLPRGHYELFANLLSIGVRSLPSGLKLTDDEDGDVRIKLYSNNDVGNHLIPLFTEDNTLATVNTVARFVKTVDPAIREELEQNILQDKYKNHTELIHDVRDMTARLGPVEMSLYFPITGRLDDGENEPYAVGERFLYAYRHDIQDAIQQHQDRGIEDIAKYYCGDAGVKAKLVSAAWTAEEIGGSVYGRVDIRLREDLTDEETEKLKDWISGQNSDGAFENLEYHPIETADGDLEISLWSDDDGYAIMTRSELDDSLGSQGMKMEGY